MAALSRKLSLLCWLSLKLSVFDLAMMLGALDPLVVWALCFTRNHRPVLLLETVGKLNNTTAKGGQV